MLLMIRPADDISSQSEAGVYLNSAIRDIKIPSESSKSPSDPSTLVSPSMNLLVFG